MALEGSNPALGLALCGSHALPAREAIATAARLGYRDVQLDATHPQTRPRALDRSARRDLAAMLRRQQLGLTGIDLWIPPEHLAEGANAERATDAVIAAIELMRELAGLVRARAVVCLTLPDDPAAEALSAIGEASRRHDVPVANHAWPAPETGTLGLDPTLAMMAGISAAKAVTQLGSRLASARLSDAGVAGRIAVGSSGGRLEVPLYAASISISAPNIPVVADVRGLADPWPAARSALSEWQQATIPTQTGGTGS